MRKPIEARGRNCRGAGAWAISLLAAATTAACAGGGRLAALYPEVAEHAGKEIEEVRFLNPEPFTKDTLQLLTVTRASRCNILGLPFCIPGTDIGRETHRLSTETAAADAARLALFYRRSGYFGTTVRPTATEIDDAVRVDFAIARGDSVVLDSLRVSGAEEVLDMAAIERRLPLKAGELFDLGEFDASADTVRTALLVRGHAYAQVLREYTADTLTDRAWAQLVAVPGPKVRVDSIEVLGAGSLGRRGALRQLLFRKGDLVRGDALVESERNLYALELVQFASVQLGPDTMSGGPLDTVPATVVVRVSEAPVHVVEAAAGYGTVECFRAQTRWMSRSFRGGGKRLTLNGSVSKVGIGTPLDFGLAGNACNAFEGDPFANELDYLVGADLTHPYFFGPRNQASLNVHADRQSEPGVYMREARGGRIALNRRLRGGGRIAARDAITGVLDAERGRTEATPVVFCLALQVCTPEDVGNASVARWRNSLSGTWVRDRTDRLVNPTRGHLLRTSNTWATMLLGSDVTFFRTVQEAAVYFPVKPGWVAAGFLRVGSILGESLFAPQGDEFLPPEDRFYAGGAYSVRGYGRNELGPLVYFTDEVVRDSTGRLVSDPDEKTAIRTVPIGGTSVIVANAEVRFPSPLLPRLMRLAAFVDAGVVDTASVWELRGLKVTPGVGLRVSTPVGPVRVDIAYKPYGPTRGPLYGTDPADPRRLVRLENAYRPDEEGFLSRIRFHLAVGQAF